MGFRDENVAARARIDQLETELGSARRELAEARAGDAQPAQSDGPPIGVVALGLALLLLMCGYFTGRAIPVVGGLLAILGVAALCFSIVAILVSRLMVVVSPNEVAVVSGRQHRSADGSMVGYRVVRRGRVLRVPVLERVDFMDLTNHPIDLEVRGVYSKGNARLTIDASANVKIAAREPLVDNAIERFLGHRRAEICAVARDTLEGSLRQVVAQLEPEELRSDLIAVAVRVMEEAEDDMSKLGLVLDTLKIQSAEEA